MLEEEQSEIVPDYEPVSVQAEDPVKAWSALVCEVAYRHHPNPNHAQKIQIHDELTRDINRVLILRNKANGGRLEVTMQQVVDWLAGSDAPPMNDDEKSPIHDALLMALGLRYVEKTNGKTRLHREELDGELKPWDRGGLSAMVAKRLEISKAYYEGGAGLEASTRQPVEQAAGPQNGNGWSQNGNGNGQPHHGHNYRNSPFLRHMKPMYPEGGYEYFPESEQRRVIANTNNVFEHLHCYRALLGETQVSAAALTGLGEDQYAHYELGRNLPPRDALLGLQRLFKGQPPQWDRFLTLLIRTRDAMAQGHELAGNDHNEATQHLREMPVQYWRSVIDQDLGKKADPAPGWADCVQPCVYRGQYLRAIRFLLDIPDDALAEELDCSENIIRDIEWGNVTNHLALRERMADFYSKAQKQIDAGAQEIAVGGTTLPVPTEAREKFFDREVLQGFDLMRKKRIRSAAPTATHAEQAIQSVNAVSAGAAI